jgi:serine/threonine-protein kinase
LDFGIAKLRVTEASVVTGTGATFGTAFYMSPEQARGAGEVDHRSDVWSMGVVLYELLSGQKPFTGEQFLQIIYQILSVEPPPLASVRSGLPPELLTLVERAMRKNPTERVPSVVALAEALAPFAAAANAGVPQTHSVPLVSETVASPQTRPPIAAVETRSGRGRAILIAGIAVAFAAIVAVAFGVGMRKSPLAVAPPTAVHAIAAPPATPVSIPPPTPSAVPAAVAPTPVAPPPASEPAVAKTVSGLSGQSEHRSDKHRSPSAKRTSTPVPPPPASKPASPQDPARAGHPIEIEKNDPYGR